MIELPRGEANPVNAEAIKNADLSGKELENEDTMENDQLSYIDPLHKTLETVYNLEDYHHMRHSISASYQVGRTFQSYPSFRKCHMKHSKKCVLFGSR